MSMAEAPSATDAKTMRKGMTQVAALAVATAIGLGAAAMPAAAQQANPPALRGKQAGDFLIGLSGIAVVPQNGGTVSTIGGTAEASSSATAQLDFTYFFMPWLSANLIAATTRHDLTVVGSAVGDVPLGQVWALPPTLTLQVHPLPNSRFSPYLGLGVNYTIFYGENGRGRSPAVTSVQIGNSFGMAVNAGLDVEVAPNWLVNIDLKKIFFLEPTARVDTVLGRVSTTAEINPWVFGAGIRYRF
jgi:outer membrane protein